MKYKYSYVADVLLASMLNRFLRREMPKVYGPFGEPLYDLPKSSVKHDRPAPTYTLPERRPIRVKPDGPRIVYAARHNWRRLRIRK